MLSKFPILLPFSTNMFNPLPRAPDCARYWGSSTHSTPTSYQEQKLRAYGENRELILGSVAWATRSVVPLLWNMPERLRLLGFSAGWLRELLLPAESPSHILAPLPAPWGVSALSVMATLALRKMRSPPAFVSWMAREWPPQMNRVHPQEVGRLPFPVYFTLPFGQTMTITWRSFPGFFTVSIPLLSCKKRTFHLSL